MERSRTVYDLLRHQDVADAERAVVEAAKAFYGSTESDPTYWTRKRDLETAVEALEKAEEE